jgi:hypothetical protein
MSHSVLCYPMHSLPLTQFYYICCRRASWTLHQWSFRLAAHSVKSSGDERCRLTRAVQCPEKPVITGGDVACGVGSSQDKGGLKDGMSRHWRLRKSRGLQAGNGQREIRDDPRGIEARRAASHPRREDLSEQWRGAAVRASCSWVAWVGMTFAGHRFGVWEQQTRVPGRCLLRSIHYSRPLVDASRLTQ